MDLLLSSGVSLTSLVRNGSVNKIETLIMMGKITKDIFCIDDCLLLAIRYSQYGVVEMLLRHEIVNVNGKDEHAVEGATPLMEAVCQGDEELISLLLSYKADTTVTWDTAERKMTITDWLNKSVGPEKYARCLALLQDHTKGDDTA